MTSPTTAAALRGAAAIGELFDGVFQRLEEWRQQLEAAGPQLDPGRLDGLVYPLVEPSLTGASPLLIGAGYIAAPDDATHRHLRFSWWLGPLESNPLFGTTTEPSRLDLSTREYADYLNDFRALEWYSVPESTHRRHVTGPYVDHLCTCDYILTLTMPVEIDGIMMGVVGADVYIKRLENDLLPLLEDFQEPVALVNRVGRVLVSTDPALSVGSLVAGAGTPQDTDSWIPCSGTPLFLVVNPH